MTIPEPSPALANHNNDQLVSRGGVPLSYDAAGNLVYDGTNSYTWDARGRLSSVTLP